jgi:hypothetical protein
MTTDHEGFMRRRLEQRYIERQHRLKLERNWALGPHPTFCGCDDCWAVKTANDQRDEAQDDYIQGLHIPYGREVH